MYYNYNKLVRMTKTKKTIYTNTKKQLNTSQYVKSNLKIKTTNKKSTGVKKNRKFTNSQLKLRSLYKLRKTIKNHDMQEGGFFDAIKHRYNMFRFKNLIAKFNEADLQMKSYLKDFKAQADILETLTKQKSKLATDVILNTKRATIFTIYSNEAEIDDNKQSYITDQIKMLEAVFKRIRNESEQNDKDMKSQYPKFKEFTSKFKKYAEKFINLLNELGDLSAFREKVLELKAKYDKLDKAHVYKSSDYRKILSSWKANEADYKKVLELSDVYTSEKKKILDDIDDFQEKAEFYKNEFENLENKKTEKENDLVKWDKSYNTIYSEMNKMIDLVKKITLFFDELDKNANKIEGATFAIFNEYKKFHNNEAIRKFKSDMLRLKELVSASGKNIADLKQKFFKEVPAKDIKFDYQLIEAGLNYSRKKMCEYYQIFNGIDTDERLTKVQEGGYYSNFRGVGGAYPRGRGRGRGRRSNNQSRVRGDICKSFTSDITNKKLYKLPFEKLEHNINEIHKRLSDHDSSCFYNAKTYEKVLENFFYIWLTLYFYRNGTDYNKKDFIEIVQIYKTINEILNNSAYVFDSNKQLIASIFKKWKSSTVAIPSELKSINRNQETFESVFISPNTQPPPAPPPHPQKLARYREIETLRTRADLREFNDFMTTVSNEDDDDFYGVLNKYPDIEEAIDVRIMLDAPLPPPEEGSADVPIQKQVSVVGSHVTDDYLNGLIKKTQNVIEAVTDSPMFFDDSIKRYAYDFKTLLERQLKGNENYVKKDNDTKVAFSMPDKLNEDIKNKVDELEYFIKNSKDKLDAQEERETINIIKLYENLIQISQTVVDKLSSSTLNTLQKASKAKEACELYFEKMIPPSEAIDRIVSPFTGSSSISNVSVTGRTPSKTESGTTKNQASQINSNSGSGYRSPESSTSSYKKLDTKYLGNIIKDIPVTGFELQKANAIEGVNEIKKILKSVCNEDNDQPLKLLSNIVQTITQLLIDLKYIEAKVIDVKVKDEQPVSLKFSPLLEQVKHDSKELHTLSGSEEIYKMIKEDQELNQIYDIKKSITEQEMDKVIFELENNPDTALTSSNRDLYYKITSNYENIQAFLKLLKERKPNRDEKDKITKTQVCNVLRALYPYLDMKSGDNKITPTIFKDWAIYNNYETEKDKCFTYDIKTQSRRSNNIRRGGRGRR
jgi:hypothetical protein